MTSISSFLLAMGIPSAITGILVWWLKKHIDAQEQKRLEREENQKQLMFMMLQSTSANNVGITAIAHAVQRIPDAHCNGDMTSALEEMEQLEKAESDFLTDLGLKHLFEKE